MWQVNGLWSAGYFECYAHAAELSQNVADAMKSAEMLVRRNEVGDRESAVALLKEHFEIVVEVGV